MPNKANARQRPLIAQREMIIVKYTKKLSTLSKRGELRVAVKQISPVKFFNAACLTGVFLQMVTENTAEFHWEQVTYIINDLIS